MEDPGDAAKCIWAACHPVRVHTDTSSCGETQSCDPLMNLTRSLWSIEVIHCDFWLPRRADNGRENVNEEGSSAYHVVFSLENLIPGTFPIRLTIIRRRLFPVSTLTALPIVILSKLIPFTSAILSPTHRPARSAKRSDGCYSLEAAGHTKALCITLEINTCNIWLNAFSTVLWYKDSLRFSATVSSQLEPASI